MASIALSHIRCFVESPELTFGAYFQENLSQFHKHGQSEGGVRGVNGALDAFSKLGGCSAVLVQTPVSDHVTWNRNKRDVLKVLYLELCACNLPQSKFFDVASEFAL